MKERNDSQLQLQVRITWELLHDNESPGSAFNQRSDLTHRRWDPNVSIVKVSYVVLPRAANNSRSQGVNTKVLEHLEAVAAGLCSCIILVSSSFYH